MSQDFYFTLVSQDTKSKFDDILMGFSLQLIDINLVKEIHPNTIFIIELTDERPLQQQKMWLQIFSEQIAYIIFISNCDDCLNPNKSFIMSADIASPHMFRLAHQILVDKMKIFRIEDRIQSNSDKFIGWIINKIQAEDKYDDILPAAIQYLKSKNKTSLLNWNEIAKNYFKILSTHRKLSKYFINRLDKKIKHGKRQLKPISKPLIIVADDDALWLKEISNVAEQLFDNVVTCSDGDSILNLLDKNIKLAILDVLMPLNRSHPDENNNVDKNKGGLRIASILAKRHIPVLLVTSDNPAELRKQTPKQDVINIVRKIHTKNPSEFSEHLAYQIENSLEISAQKELFHKKEITEHTGIATLAALLIQDSGRNISIKKATGIINDYFYHIVGIDGDAQQYAINELIENYLEIQDLTQNVKKIVASKK